MDAKALRQFQNVWAAKHFAIAIGSMMVLFIGFHWLSIAYLKYGHRRRSSQALARRIRKLQRFLAISVFGLTLSRWCLYLVYWIISLVLLLTNVDLHNHVNVAKRLGWITISNLVLVVSLSLRNTPLAPLSGHSYEKLRVLHKTAGYTCITCAILHAAVYLSAWSEAGTLGDMRETQNLFGGIAGVSVLIIGASTIPWFRKRFYEVFYLIHVTLFMLILVMIGMHRPIISKSTLVITIFMASVWFSDKVIRLAKLCWYMPGNHATIHIMPDGALRVSLSRSIRCSAGSHAYLWIPAIRAFETHPFTIVSQTPVEFLIRVHDGFTRDLYKTAAALQNTEQPLRCSIDGGYGQIPDFGRFDRVLLVSGGSGASFGFAVALDLVKKYAAFGADATEPKKIHFVWTVRQQESLSWFDKELAQLQECPHVQLLIHVTHDDSKAEDNPKDNGRDTVTMTQAPTITTNPVADTEKGPMVNQPHTPLFSNIQKGRPDLSKYISGFINSCAPDDRVGIGACGPVGMIDSVHKVLAQGAYDDGPSITMYNEEFGW